jgi:mRNA interferase MazF
MKRGEVWTVSGAGYAGKPRPSVIVQSDQMDAFASVTVCSFTTDATELPLFRILVQPDASNGLHEPSRVMVDKITTVHKSKVGKRLGEISPAQMEQVENALLIHLGMT